jgi:hypothetical protein
MRLKKIVGKFWRDLDARRWDRVKGYFTKDAEIKWPNTGERFKAADFQSVNGEYPDDWRVSVEKILKAGNTIISVVKASDGSSFFHATSFFTFKSRKIASLHEYWGEVGKPQNWRGGDTDTNANASADIDADPDYDEEELEEASDARISKIPIGDIPPNIKKSAWTRLFFPDDAV